MDSNPPQKSFNAQCVIHNSVSLDFIKIVIKKRWDFCHCFALIEYYSNKNNNSTFCCGVSINRISNICAFLCKSSSHDSTKCTVVILDETLYSFCFYCFYGSDQLDIISH